MQARTAQHYQQSGTYSKCSHTDASIHMYIYIFLLFKSLFFFWTSYTDVKIQDIQPWNIEETWTIQRDSFYYSHTHKHTHVFWLTSTIAGGIFLASLFGQCQYRSTVSHNFTLYVLTYFQISDYIPLADERNLGRLCHQHRTELITHQTLFCHFTWRSESLSEYNVEQTFYMKSVWFSTTLSQSWRRSQASRPLIQVRGNRSLAVSYPLRGKGTDCPPDVGRIADCYRLFGTRR